MEVTGSKTHTTLVWLRIGWTLKCLSLRILKINRNICKDLELYSQLLIFFLTYKSDQKTRLLHNIKLERLANEKHSNLLGLFITYEENEVL
jgi:hypothetical protein